MKSQTVKIEGAKDRIKGSLDVLNCFNTKESKLYWLNVLVNEGELTQAEAGFIIVNQGLI